MNGQSHLKVVCNTGPLIGLARVGLESLLFRLFQEVIIPSAVRDELLAKTSPDHAKLAAVLQMARIYECQHPPNALLAAELDRGEAEVITAAQELGLANVLVDERKARRIASNAYKLNVKGTAGLLVDAKKAGMISTVAPYLDGMIQAGYFLGPTLVAACLKAAKE